jgi:Flp pilus assembly pilin Flp
MKGQSARQAGQGMTEYLIIVALVAIAAIGLYSAFGKIVRGQTAAAANALAGHSASESRTEVNDASETATAQAQREFRLNNFDQSGKAN